MLRREGSQPARCLLELTFAADAVASFGLVPRDRDVDEPLEEVLLGRLRGAPGVLERLVGLEVLAPADLLEPCAEVLVHAAECYARDDVATILLAGVDLYFRGKLEASLPDHRLITADGVEPPDLVIADISRIDPDDVAESFPDVPLLGFSNHTDTAGLRAANAAGFDQVVVKSALVERVPQLVDDLIS